jgi:hypothetical protein
MVSYESIYQGASDNLSPSYSPKAYDIGTTDMGTLGMAQDARTANQLGALKTTLNPGQKVIEIQGTSAEVWESVPEQHIDEMRRVMKLTGVKPSFHAPTIEASGFSQEGWNESNRESAEKQIESAVLRSQRLDPDGNISVTIHSTAQLPEMIKKVKTKDGEVILNAFAIDPVSGKAQPLEQGKRFFREGEKFTGKQIKFEPQKEIDNLNELQWHNKLAGINTQISNGESSIEHAIRVNVGDEQDEEEKNKKIKKGYEIIGKLQAGVDVNRLGREESLTKEQMLDISHNANHSAIYFKDAYANMKAIFDSAYANASGEDKKKLAAFAKEAAPKVKNGLKFKPEEFQDFKEVVSDGLKILGGIKTPETFKPLNDFIVDQSSQTFANVATSAYKKYKENTPIINIENPPAGGGLSRAQDIKELVIASRKKLVKNLVKDGMGEGQAKKESKKLIGATWDVGHINMLRKSGYSEKDLIKEAEIVAPYVKHVHLSDNFGFEHTELPMGMGNVPMKKIMKKLGEKGFKGQKIIEAFQWWQHFGEQGGGNPFKPTIEAFDSPIYAMKGGPSWGDPVGASSYYSGHGPINTPIHHSVYGAGFTTLPSDLGGEIPGGNQDRFSGTPMQ